MRYISVDLETTGLSLNSDIIEMGIVIDDLSEVKPVEELPKLRILFRHHVLSGEPYALGMHVESGLLAELQKRTYADENWVQVEQGDDRALYNEAKSTLLVQAPEPPFGLVAYSQQETFDLYYLAWQFVDKWLLENYYQNGVRRAIRMAGKNIASFDARHLEEKCFTDYIKIDFRFLDIGPMYMEEHYANGGVWVPNLKDCLKYAGVQKEISHTSIEDSYDVINCIRHKLLDQGS